MNPPSSRAFPKDFFWKYFLNIKEFCYSSIHPVLLADASGGAVFGFTAGLKRTGHFVRFIFRVIVTKLSANSHLFRLILLPAQVGFLFLCQIPAAKLVFANPDDSGVQKKDGAPRPRPFALN